MRRIGILAATVVLLLAGCGREGGTDGDLTNHWPAMPAAQLVLPTVGQCWMLNVSPGVSLVTGWPGIGTDCAQSHHVETAFVGRFTGEPAQSPQPPVDSGPADQAAYADCQVQVKAYLGDDWRAGPFKLALTVPSPGEWRVGARWYRCDLWHLASLYPANDPKGYGPVRGGLSGSRPLALTCLATQETAARSITFATPSDCAQAHAAEYVGVISLPDGPYPTSDRLVSVGNAACQTMVAHYLGFARESDWTNRSVGLWWIGFDKDRWILGDRTARCFAYAYTKSGTMVGSVKGIGNRTPNG